MDTTVVVIGTTTVDTLIFGAYTPGAKHPSVVICAGGGSCNCAALICGLGITTTLVTVVGSDELTDIPLSEAALSGVQVLSAKIPELITPRFVGLIGTRGEVKEKYLLHTECFDQLRLDLLATHLSNLKPAVVIVNSCVDNGLFEATKDVVARYDAQLYLAVTPEIHAPKIIKWFPHVDILFLNQEEAGRLLSTAAPSVKEIMTLADRLVSLGVGASVITAGSLGLIYAARDIQAEHLPVNAIAKPVSVLGAGDAIVAGATAGLLRGLDFRSALQYAQDVAIAVVQSATHVPVQLPKLPNQTGKRIEDK